MSGGGLFMQETESDQVDYREFELNCAFYGGHSFTADNGQKCIWCTARKPDEVQADA